MKPWMTMDVDPLIFIYFGNCNTLEHQTWLQVYNFFLQGDRAHTERVHTTFSE